jgi:hypothetical protein
LPWSVTQRCSVSFSSIRPENYKALAMRIAADFDQLHNPGPVAAFQRTVSRQGRVVAYRSSSTESLFLMWRRREAEGRGQEVECKAVCTENPIRVYRMIEID